LLCTELSRLARNPVDGGVIVSLLDTRIGKNKRKYTYLKEIRTLDKKFKTISTDKFTLSLFLSISKYENDIRASNTSSGMNNQKEKGKTTNIAPLGYLNIGNKKGDKEVTQDGKNFEICRDLWEMLLSEKYSLKDIYAYARSTSLTTYRGKGRRTIPDSSTIKNMFSNKYFAGYVPNLNEKDERIWNEGIHPQMVTDEEFTQAQIILKKLGNKHAKIEKAIDVADIIKALAISGIHNNDDGKPCSIGYSERTRYTCIKCKHKYYRKEVCDKCNTPRTKNTKEYKIQSFVHFLKDAKTRKKRDSISLKTIIPQLEKQLTQLYISERMFTVLKKLLYTKWEEKNKSYLKEKKALYKRRDELEKNLGKIEASIIVGTEQNGELAIKSVKEEHQMVLDALEKISDDYEDTFDKALQSLLVFKDYKNI